jgi:uncharacterized protein
VRIVVAGGSGLLGRALIRRLLQAGHTVAVLTRSPRHLHDLVWNPETPDGPWADTVATADAVINLAGESVAGRRWTAARKIALRDSRVRSTRALAAAIRGAATPPVFLSGSAIGIYGPHGSEPVTEETPPGSDFLASLCVAWEREADAVAGLTRVVLLRTGVVLAREGGALPQMALPFTLFAGGRIASGQQCVPWIHIDDWVEMVRWALETPEVNGPLNVTAPHPVSNAEMARALGRALHRPALLPVPEFALRLVLGEMAGVLVHGQCVVPAKARRLGFTFRHPEIAPALADLYR